MIKKNLGKLCLYALTVCCADYYIYAANTSATKNRGLTAQDQAKGSPKDVETTRIIRSHLVDDDTLSARAKNLTVVTVNGVVTLKGAVLSQAERNRVLGHASMIVSAHKIKDEMEVVPEETAR